MPPVTRSQTRRAQQQSSGGDGGGSGGRGGRRGGGSRRDGDRDRDRRTDYYGRIFRINVDDEEDGSGMVIKLNVDWHQLNITDIARREVIKENISRTLHKALHSHVCDHTFDDILWVEYGSQKPPLKKKKTDDIGENMTMNALENTAKVNEAINTEEVEEIGGKRKFSEVDEEERCSICLTEYEDKEEIKQLDCDHRFHPDCLEQWFQDQATCPCCRQCVSCYPPNMVRIIFTEPSHDYDE